ncbi:MAG: carboxypeptidase-like regulatory domain-containing protein [Bacteroidia bacterium]
MKQYFTLIRLSLSVLLFFMLGTSFLLAQTTVAGVVTDAITGKPVVGATVAMADGSAGANTKDKGVFSFKTPQSPPFEIRITFVSYQTQTFTVETVGQSIEIKLPPATLEEVEIVASASQERQKQSPLTLESMSIAAIKETPAADFYEGLGHLKGVDLNSASIGFKVVNTRGFNGPTPVRSLQVIDGVDNQSPGLNFSLGNFLGAAELDIESVDIVVGASSAFYGPNAFNGVVSMKTKSPFIHKGLTAQVQVGERSKGELGLRYAKAFQNAAGEDKFAFKINAYYLSVQDWEADNLDPVDGTDASAGNLGGVDGVNRYGDEFNGDATSLGEQRAAPGLGLYHRTGYMERDVIDYDTRNYKVAGALHYMLTPKIEAIGAFNTAGGTLVMQTLNRIRLDDISFYQARLELRQKNKFFVRAYRTWEDAGKSYDAYFTANRLQDRVKTDDDWQRDYRNQWGLNITPRIRALEGFPQQVFGQPYPAARVDSFLSQPHLQDSLVRWHSQVREFADQNGISRLEPGTAAFDSAFNQITSASLANGGTRIVDKSALWHGHGEYRFTIADVLDEVVVGGNFREYLPQTFGNIFSDTLQQATGEYTVIKNSEWGAYVGIEKKLLDDRLKLNATSRFDKNQNFKLVPTFLVSGVFKLSSKVTLRAAFSSAVRNPTLADQYLFYRTSANTTQLGNLNGFPNLADTASYTAYRNDPSKDTTLLKYFDVAPIQPEKVQTIEVGGRVTVADRMYIDAGAYFSRYRDFIGYNVGLTYGFFRNGLGQRTNIIVPSSIEVWRLAANATQVVTTMGAAIGVDYYIKGGYTIGGNYSWNVLNTEASDPILPAFNTPEHKFNLRFSGRDVTIAGIEHLGFSVNYKWVDQFIFEGSPSFTGLVPQYDMVDMQINKRFPSINTTFKLGASNLLNNKVFTLYGGPRVGRLGYFAITTDLFKPKEK